MSQRAKRQEALNKAETRLVTVEARAIRYQASSSNYRRVSASLFEMRSLTVDDDTLRQMVSAAWIPPHFIRLQEVTRRAGLATAAWRTVLALQPN